MADIVHLIQQLKRDFGPDFIITLAPVASALLEGANLSGFDYIALENAVGDQISWYNAQFYSGKCSQRVKRTRVHVSKFAGFGEFFPDDQYLDIVNFGLDPSRLVATTLTSPDAGFGFIDIDSIISSVQALASQQEFNFGGVAGSLIGIQKRFFYLS